MIARSKCKRLRGFEVEWCKHIPVIKHNDGSEDADIDNATYGRADHDTLAEATAFAKVVAATAEFRYAKVTEFVMEPISRRFPDLLEREYLGEGLVVEHDDGPSSGNPV